MAAPTTGWFLSYSVHAHPGQDAPGMFKGEVLGFGNEEYEGAEHPITRIKRRNVAARENGRILTLLFFTKDVPR